MMINSFGGYMPALQSSNPAASNRYANQSQQADMPSRSYNSGSASPSYSSMIMPMLGNFFGGASQQIGSGLQNLGNNLGNGLSNSMNALGQMGSGLMSGLSGLSRMNRMGRTQQNQHNQAPQASQSGGGIRKTGQQIYQSVSSGADQALKDIGSMITQNAPSLMAFGGSMMGAGAACPYAAGGMAATGAALLMGQNKGHAAAA